MHGIDKSQIVSWRRQKNSHYANYFPGAINTNCPYCNSLVSFSFSNWHKALHGFSFARVGCPVCAEKVRFMLLDHDPANQELCDAATLWYSPAPQVKKPLQGLDSIEELDQRLILAYESTIKVYNTGEWNATAILARRFMDDLLDNCLPDEYRTAPVDEKLAAITQLKDFSAPLTALAAAAAEGSPLGQSLELQVTPDQKTVTEMIELINLLVEYLYLFPNRVKSFHTDSAEHPQVEQADSNSKEPDGGMYEIRGTVDNPVDDALAEAQVQGLERPH